MIVPAMNSEEIIREVFLDLPSVIRKSHNFAHDQRRLAIKSKHKTAINCYDYKSPRKNEWILFLKSTPSFCGSIIAVHYLNKLGFNCLIITQDHAFHHFSGHFLERYNERFLKYDNFSKLEIFKDYIHKNIYLTSEDLDTDEYKIKRCMIKIENGIAFGTKEEINGYQVMDFKTFISNDMVLDFQKEDVDYIKNNYKTYYNEHPSLRRMQSI
jgi:hypothetical protein